MSELDQLREMLDEAGVGYLNRSSDVTIGCYTDPHTATEAMDGTLQMTGLTAEQVMRALELRMCRMNESDLPVFNGHDDGYFSICSECGFAIYMRRIWAPLKYCSNCGRKVVDA